MGAAEGETGVTYEQLIQMEQRQAARLEKAVKALNRPTNFMIGSTAGAFMVNIFSGLILVCFCNAMWYLGKQVQSRALIPLYTYFRTKLLGSDLVAKEAAPRAFLALTVLNASSSTSDIDSLCRELLVRNKVRRPLKGLKLSFAKKFKKKSNAAAAALSCDEGSSSSSSLASPSSTSSLASASSDMSTPSSDASTSAHRPHVSITIGLLMPSTTLTTVDKQAEDLQRRAADILPRPAQFDPLRNGSIFLSATVTITDSAMDDLLHSAKELLQEGLLLDPDCTVQIGAAAILYSISGTNAELLILEEGVHDAPHITSAQKFKEKTILIKGFYLKNTEIKATTKSEKSVCLNLVYYQKLANGVDVLIAQLPQGELLGSKSFVYVNKTIFVENGTHPLVLRSKGKEIDVYKLRKPTLFGTLCKRRFWICLVILFVYQVLAFQRWRKKIFKGWFFQIIISFLSCILVEYIIIPWTFYLITRWMEFMIPLTNSDNVIKLTEFLMKIIMEPEKEREIVEHEEIRRNTASLETNNETVNDVNWEWHCYERYLHKGRWVTERAAKTASQSKVRPFDVVTTVERDGRQSVELIVHSPQLVQILRDCKPKTDAAFIEGSKIDPTELFLRREALKAYVDDAMLSGPDAQLSAGVWHVRHLVHFVERHFADTLVRYERMQMERCVSFDMLWAFFMPGDGVCRRCPVTNQQCYATVKRPAVIRPSSQGPPTCCVTLNVMDFNVTSYYKCSQTYSIPAFEGEVPFTSLQVCPLRFFPNPKDMEAHFLSGGNIFYEVAVRQPFRFMQFTGSLYFYHQEDGCRALRKLNADGRVMIDLYSFAKMNPGYPLNNAEPPSDIMVGIWRPKLGQMKKPSDEELKLAPAFAYGFSFRLKKWGCVELCGLRDIIYHGDFATLRLKNEGQKAILWTMAQQYKINGSRIEDKLEAIADKGKGWVVLCHGPPGTGKTFTAETLAETLECPLWSISAFELGDEAETVEAQLSQIMEIARNWHAILLLDEADVYLEKRDAGTNVKHKLLTCSVLRMLQYYRGIMFITTNRDVSALHDAILSRTTLTISYPALDATQRESIWRRLLTRAGIDYDATYDALATYDLNGHQIQNVVHLALLWAMQTDEQKLNMTHLLHAIDAVTAHGTKLPTPPS